MRKVTKVDLIRAAVLVAVLTAIAIAALPVTGSGSSLLLTWGAAVAVFVVVDVVFRLSSRGVAELDEPVSDAVGNGLANGVTVVWLVVVAGLLMLMARRCGLSYAAGLLALVGVAVVAGRLVQLKFRIRSLLPYAFTFLFALFASLELARICKWR